VFTLGKSGDESNLLLNESTLKAHDATYYKINRGGDITYHGPGQLVVYPILDLDNFFTDIHKYMRFLEETVIQTLAHYGVKGERFDGLTGVWIDSEKPQARKICALGVKSSRWVTMHGIGFNVNSDLSYFNHIIPCGIDDKAVTSLEKEIGQKVDMEEIKIVLLDEMKKLFQFQEIHYGQKI
jgi:lipoyl(octanoyl) transferase